MFPYKELATLLDLDIASEGVSGDQPLTSDLSIRQIRALMLRRSFLKKLCPNDVVDQKLSVESLREFVDANQRMPDPSLPFSYPVENYQDELFWDYFRSNFNRALDSCDDFSLDSVNEMMSVGPGAAILADSRNFYTKLFGSKLSYTNEYQLALYRAAVSYSDTWADAEMQRFQAFGVEAVPGNRLFFVNKNTDELRTCATEANVAMLLQKALGGHYERCLWQAFRISLEKQPDNNRNLAYIGSVDGSFGTIDGTKASDSIAWALCLTVLDPRHVKWLRLFRAEATVLPDGSIMPLRMVSTMGNGFTFPLMTILFASVVRSVYQMMDLPSSDPSAHFGVFGDDIIVRREAYDFVIRSLTKLGFRVNESKSFNSGPFRESCGHDYYNGHFVRGVYVKSLETPSELFSAINRLNRWTALSGIALPRVVKFLRQHLYDKYTRILVPPSEQDDAGIKVPFDLTYPKVDNSYWFCYRRLARRVSRMRVPSSVEESRSMGYSSWNENGFYLTFLGGFASSAERPLTQTYLSEVMKDGFSPPPAFIGQRERSGSRRCKVVRTSIPYWDWEGPSVPKTALARRSWYASYADWKSAVAKNLA